jgi:hypothetical protein
METQPCPESYCPLEGIPDWLLGYNLACLQVQWSNYEFDFIALRIGLEVIFIPGMNTIEQFLPHSIKDF